MSRPTAQPAGGPLPNPWIAAIAPYVPGSAGKGHPHPVKLSANENPWGPSPVALAALAAPCAVHRYPDPGAHALRAKLAELHGLDPDRIVCGTGSDEILQLLPAIYCAPGDTVVHVHHGFQVYPLAARRAGAEPIAAPDRAFTADVDAILDCVRPDTRIVYLANPNNPTGTMISAAEVARLHAGLREDILLVVDQAYAEYLGTPDPDGAMALARTAPNVIVTRTFSKIYGLGGMRVGWATGPAAIIGEINRVRAPFPISVPSLAVAEAALGDQDYVRQCCARNLVQRKLLADAITARGNAGFSVVPSSANFILVGCPTEGPHRAELLYKALADRGYIVRYLPQQDLKDSLRISVGTEEETAGFIATFNAVLDGA